VADEKKPGKDINDLKARLGLKEQRPPTPAPQAAPAPAAADPRRDPFAAQAPRPAAVQHQPMIMDAGPEMHIPDQPKPKAGHWIKLGVIILLPSLFFFYFGLVYRARLLYNKGIEDAQTIKSEVQGIRKTTQLIFDALNKSFTRAKLDPDPQLIEDLKGLEPLNPPKTDKIFRINYTQLENVTIDRLLNYYNDTILLYATVSRFRNSAERAQADLAKAVKKAGEIAQTQYGVIIDGSGPVPVANLVMVGDPVCKDNQPQCNPEDWVGMKVKASTASSWTQKQLEGEDGQRVLPLAPDKPLAQQVLIGSAEYTALLVYGSQLNDIRTLSKKLVDGEKDLLKELTDAAGKNKVFTF
jgi:hypothetical protein